MKWHNGDAFTSADVKFSIERTYDPAAKTMVGTVFTTIDRVEAPDPMTLVIHTKKSDPLLPDRLAFYGGQIVPKKYLEDVGPDTFNAKPVGTGPVRLVVVDEGRQGRLRGERRTTGAERSTSTGWCGGRSPRRRRAWLRCSRARWTRSRSFPRTTGIA